MKRMTMMILVLAPSLALAEANHEWGVSGNVVSAPQGTVTDWMLEQQRALPPRDASELPADIYVATQRRIADTFSVPVPESLADKASSTKSTTSN